LFFCVFLDIKNNFKKIKKYIILIKKKPNHIYKGMEINLVLVGRAHVGEERRVLLIVIMYGKNDCVPHNFCCNHGINEIKIQS
jgi:hypothetical protein